MTIISNILIGLAVLATVLLFALKADMGRLSGPDRSGAEIVFFIVMGFRWLLIATVLAACVGGGKFDWIGGGPGPRYLAVLGTHAGLGFVSAMAMAMTVSHIGGMRVGPFGVLGWGGMPVLVMMIALAAADGRFMARDGGVRWLQYGLAALGALGWASALTILISTSIQSSRQRAEHEAAARAESAAQEAMWNAKQAAEDEALEQMDPGLPLDDWIVQTHIQYSDKHQARAAELIQQRPRLVEELTEMLRRDDPMQREYANTFIRELKPPPRGLIDPLARAESKLAAQIQDGIDGCGPMPSHVCGMSKSTLKTAAAMGDPAELRTGLSEILAVIEPVAESDDLKDLVEKYRYTLSI